MPHHDVGSGEIYPIHSPDTALRPPKGFHKEPLHPGQVYNPRAFPTGQEAVPDDGSIWRRSHQFRRRWESQAFIADTFSRRFIFIWKASSLSPKLRAATALKNSCCNTSRHTLSSYFWARYCGAMFELYTWSAKLDASRRSPAITLVAAGNVCPYFPKQASSQ